MKKLKNFFAAFLAAVLVLAVFPISAAATGTGTPAGTVYISVVDYGIRKEDELAESGKIPDEYKQPLGVILPRTAVEFYEGENIAQITCRYFEELGWTPVYTGSTESSFYLSKLYGFYNSVAKKNVTKDNAFGEKVAGADSGWMITLNDWFISAGASEFAVADGDIIEWQYTCRLGTDLGGGWGGDDKTVKAMTFSAGTLDKAFDKDTREYTLTVPAGTTAVTVEPTASNKNFMVKSFVGTAEYKRTASVPVSNGTVITVKCGDPSWASMNETTTPAEVYTFTVAVESGAALGDVNGDGKINVTDVMLTLQYAAGNIASGTAAWNRADVNGDKKVNVTDVMLILQVAAGNLKSFPSTQ